MAFPPAHMLIGVGLAECARAGMRHPPQRIHAWAAAALLASAADGDIILGMLLGKGGTYHGTFTHSVTAAAVVAMAAWALGGARWAMITGLAYGSHLLVDLLDGSGPTNLMLGWPFTGARPYSLGKVFPKVPIHGDSALDSALNLLSARPLTILLMQTLLAAAIFAALLLAAQGIQRVRVGRGG